MHSAPRVASQLVSRAGRSLALVKSIDAISCWELTGRLVLPHAELFAWPKLFMGKDSSQGRKGTILVVEQQSRSEGEGWVPVWGPRVCHSDSCPPTPSYSFLRSTVRDGQQKTQLKIRIAKLEFKALQFQQEGGWRGGACHPKWSSGWVSWSILRGETSWHPRGARLGPYTAHWLYWSKHQPRHPQACHGSRARKRGKW